MCNMGSWFIATMQKYNEEAEGNGVEPVNFGIVKYPHPDGAPAGSTLGTVTSLAVNANSEKKDAALDFVNWCASEDGRQVRGRCRHLPRRCQRRDQPPSSPAPKASPLTTLLSKL